MKKLGLLFVAVLMISLSSCGGDNANKAKDAAKDAVEATKDAAKDAVEATKDAAKDAAEATKDAAKDAVDATKDAAKDAVDATKDAAKDAVDATKDAAKDAVDAVKGADGAALFASNGCTACHNMTAKTVGPSVKEIAAKYAGKKDDMVKFLKGEGTAIVDPAQFAIMKPNLENTKKMTDAERAALADYMLAAK